VVRDDAVPDAKTYKSRLYHIYNDPDVKDDLNRRASPEEPLPDLVLNAYYLLAYDWREAWKAWRGAGQPTPPVMITLCNRTETAARVKHAFDSKRIHVDELCDPERVLHIDSKVLDQAEAQEEPAAPVEVPDAGDDGDEDDAPVERKLTKAEQAELLRRTVDTVGKAGQPGEKVQKVISVGMLNEGWDAKTAVEPDPAKAELEIRWPNVVRIERSFQPTLTLDWSKAARLELDAGQTAQVAELAPSWKASPT